MSGPPGARRVKVSATLDATLLSAVDAFVGRHPGLDRSKVLDAALRLWYAQQQERAMEAQYLEPQSEEEQAELAAWRRIASAAAERSLGLR